MFNWRSWNIVFTVDTNAFPDFLGLLDSHIEKIDPLQAAEWGGMWTVAIHIPYST